MNFPDQNHIHQIQEDLWQWPTSRSAVMVGAGFSLNSIPQAGVRSQFPLWNDIVKAMYNDLYPENEGNGSKYEQAYQDEHTCIDPLRLASKYEAAFGRQKLNALLRKEIPNEKRLPGELHTLLLSLPWKDVLTTNYDTLLERTEVQGRAYQPVVSFEDLTTRFSPRIIKLHGSFPSKTPFIITEEDYRTYPDRFAPFVNTVQQILIENSLVLVGFSGDDPNFLQWIGWIRDHLGNSHAPIYLVGALSLGNAERILLNQRGITPIDLSPLFFNSSFLCNKHSAPLEWFFKSLIEAKPQRPDDWLMPSDSVNPDDPGRNMLPPLISRRGKYPLYPIGMGPELDKPLNFDDVSKLISNWIFERENYPGWLVAPHTKKTNLWFKTKSWMVPVINFIKGWSAADRILILREFDWRFDIVMAPLFHELSTAMKSAVEDCYLQLESGKQLSVDSAKELFINSSHNDIVTAWIDLAFSLLRESRHMYDNSSWNSLKEKIDRVVLGHSIDKDRLYYEEILWNVNNLDRRTAKAQLSEWEPSSNSPLARIHKASLLAELDEVNEAQLLLQDNLKDIRKALLSQGQNIELLSLEGWCTYLIYIVSLSLNSMSRRSLLQEFSPRWSELRAWDCDPWSIKRYYEGILSFQPPSAPKPGKNIVPQFDPGSINIFYQFVSDDSSDWLPAFEYIRLFEKAGVPLRLPNVNTSGDTLVNACKRVDPFIGHWSPAILIRARKLNELKNYDYLSRVDVGFMDSDSAERFHQWNVDALTKEIDLLSANSAPDSLQKSPLEGLIEHVSRLAFKVKPISLETSFQLAIKMYKMRIARLDQDISQSLESWFKRLFEAADTDKIIEWIPPLIQIPIWEDEENETVPHRTGNFDPLQYIHIDRCKAFLASNRDITEEIRSSVEYLIKQAKTVSGESNKRIATRLILVRNFFTLTSEQEYSLGQMIWSNTPEDALPNMPLYYHSYIRLPHPPEIDVVKRIRSNILLLSPSKSVSISDDKKTSFTPGGKDKMIYEVAMASKSMIQLFDEDMGLIKWNVEESKLFLLKAINWWNNDKVVLDWDSSTNLFAESGRDYILANIIYFDIFLALAVLPNMKKLSQDDWDQVLACVKEAREKEIYLSVCLPYMLLSHPNMKDYIEDLILDGFSGESKEAIEGGAKSVRHWIHLSSKDLVPRCSNKLLDNLVKRVVFRRYAGIYECITQISYLLVEQPDALTQRQVNLLIASLDSWRDALKLPLEEEKSGDFLEHERPFLRTYLPMLCVALLKWIQMKKPKPSEPQEIQRWKEECEKDPLPEVRRAFELWYLHFDKIEA